MNEPSGAPHNKSSTLRMRITALIRLPAFAAACTFAVVLTTVLGTWWLVREQSLQTARGQFEQRAAHITNDLQEELATCEYVLRSASGLLAVSPTLTPEAWRQYVTRLDMDDTLSIVRALGYATLGRGAAAVSAEDRPFATVQLMTPARAEAPATGYDLGRDPTRRAALLRALDSGELTLDALAAPTNATPEPPHTHLELYLPVHGHGAPGAAAEVRVPVAGSETAAASAASAAAAGAAASSATTGAAADAHPDFDGMLVAVVDPRRLFERGMSNQSGIDLQVLAGSPATTLYTSTPGDTASDAAPLVRKTDTLRFGGEAPTLVYTTSERYLAAGNDYTAMTVLVAGLASAMLLAALAWLLARARSGVSV